MWRLFLKTLSPVIFCRTTCRFGRYRLDQIGIDQCQMDKRDAGAS
jgi:hypothetical protein